MTTQEKKINIVLNELNNYTKTHLGQSIFTTAITTDEIKNTLDLYFRPYEESQDYEYSLRLGMMFRGIDVSEDDFYKHYSEIKKYINILLKLFS